MVGERFYLMATDFLVRGWRGGFGSLIFHELFLRIADDLS